MTTIKLSVLTPLYFQNIFFPNTGLGASSPTTFVGPVSTGLDTTLTNVGPSGKHFTKKQKAVLLADIGQEGILARQSLAALEKLSDTDRAELDLAESERTYSSAADPFTLVDANEAVKSAKGRLGKLRAAEARQVEIDKAKAQIRQQIKDAASKRRGH